MGENTIQEECAMGDIIILKVDSVLAVEKAMGMFTQASTIPAMSTIDRMEI